MRRNELFIVGSLLLGGNLMHAASGNQPEREPWRVTEQEKERIRNRTSLPSKAEEEIAHYESRRKWAWDHVNPPEMLMQNLAPMLSNVKAHQDDGIEFEQALGQISHRLSTIGGLNALIPASAADALVQELVSLFWHRKSRRTLSTHSLVRLIAKYGGSSEAKSVIVEALSSAEPSLQDDAVMGLAWNRYLHGDHHVYGKLAELQRTEGAQNITILAVMARLDRERTLPLLLAQLRATKDLKAFIRLSDGLSEYRRPELIEAILARLKDFPEENSASPLNATVGIAPDLLLSYIANADGEKLELALEALGMNAIALGKSYPVLSKKLDDRNPRSRIATARCIKKATELGAFGEESVVRDLETRAAQEAEGEVSADLRTAVAVIRKHLEPRQQ